MKPGRMDQGYYDLYQGLLEGTANGYAGLLGELRERFGVNFLVENVGGGCEAIRGVLEQWIICITNGTDFLSSTMTERAELERAGQPCGWFIGIYRLLNNDDLDYEDDPAVFVHDEYAPTASLPALLDVALRRLVRGKHDVRAA